MTGDDLFHIDYTSGNVLFDNAGTVTGVIDWNFGVARGDRHFALIKTRLELSWGLLDPDLDQHHVQRSAVERLDLNRYGFSAASFRVREDGVMPEKIDPVVRERAVRRVLEHRAEYASLTAAAAAVARRERLGAETVRRWVLQAEVDVGARPGATSVEHAEIKKLKAENAQLREGVAILKAATSFFVGELDPRNR